MGNITINSNITGGGGGGTGDVGGASNLTTVGAIPYVSASGVLNQTANLSFDVANNRLVLESATVQRFSTDLSLSRASAGVLQVGDGAANANGTVNAGNINLVLPTYFASARIGISNPARTTDAAYIDYIGAGDFTGDISFATNGITANTGATEKVRLIGDGTFRIYNTTPTTGVTRAVIRAGAGQSTTNLTEWQNSGGTTVLLSIGPGGVISAQGNVLGITNTAVSTIQFGSTYGLGWSSTGTYGGAKDVAITRNAAGVIEVNSGTAGTYRDLILRRSQHNGVTVADLPAAAAGNAGSIQYVTDANATTIGSTVAGGGANKVMVWSNGAAWKIFAS